MPLYYSGRPDIQAKYFIGGSRPKTIDLAPYITSINISKDMSQPAGMWEMNLVTDFIQRGILNPKELTPFDYMEMLVRSDPGLARPFYHTRGFVDNVSQATDGAPGGGRMQRQISINGRDYGSLLQNYKIYNITKDQQQQQFIFSRVTDELGIKEQQNINASGLVYKVIHKALNDIHILGNTSGTHDPSIPGLKTFQTNMQLVNTRVNMPNNMGTVITYDNFLNFNGSLDEFIRQVQSPPWGEYFIRDDWDQPRVYFRVPPYLDRDGKFANPWIKLGNADAYNTELELVWVELQPQDILSTNLTKSQNEVYTFFVSALEGGIVQGDILQSIIASETDKLGDPNHNPYFDGSSTDQHALIRAARFGFRPFEARSPLMAGSTSQNTFTGVDTVDISGRDVMTQMNQWVVSSFNRNEELESGTIVCRGIMGTRRGHNEIAARVGDYIFFQKEKGEQPYYYYIQSMDIVWSEGSPLTTTFQVIRGEQFANGVKEHPYRLYY